MNKILSTTEAQNLISILEERFSKHPERHPNIDWNIVKTRLSISPNKLWSLHQMEISGGEPDVIGSENIDGTIAFIDCSLESPKERRSLCYDKNAWDSRKQHKPENNACDVASEMGIELLTEEQYRWLQSYGNFDTKTSSWLKTPENIRKLGGAIFGDYRYGSVFIYHNGAESYYAARGFRGILWI